MTPPEMPQPTDAEVARVEDGANSHMFEKRIMVGNRCIAFADEPDASTLADAWNDRRYRAAVPEEWTDIKDPPSDSTDVLVGGWIGPSVWDEETQTRIRFGRQEWQTAISSRDDKEGRRGFRHRNGACWATHWMPLPKPPENSK